MRRLPPEVRVRRVGFRSGTDAELAAMYAVETPIEAERRPDRVPQPLERIRSERPEAVRVRTGNAYSNAPMLAINDALGSR